MPRRPLQALDHTGDVGFTLRAGSVGALFDAARAALLSELLSEPPTSGEAPFDLELTAPALDRLLLRWLDEVLYLVQTRALVPASARVTLEGPAAGAQGWRLHAHLALVPLDPDTHGWRGEVKGTTYHGLELARERGGWRARVILDV
ncbi:MAG: archease [Deinococcales bacterium]